MNGEEPRWPRADLSVARSGRLEPGLRPPGKRLIDTRPDFVADALAALDDEAEAERLLEAALAKLGERK